jgi:hypothetical protein
MRTRHTVCLLEAGFSGSRWSDSFSTQQTLTSNKEAPEVADTTELDAYTIAVLISVGATVLSLCF